MDAVLIYQHTDIPPGMTCAEYRRLRHAASRPSPRRFTKLRSAMRTHARRII